MAPQPLMVRFGIVAAQTALLYLLSRRLLLGFVLGTLASHGRGRLGTRVVSFLRLPGNLLHEASHAAAYLVSGYTVRTMATCLSDRRGRGYCEPGPPWSPLHSMPVAAAAAAAAPLIAGALALQAVAWCLGIDLPALDLLAGGHGPAKHPVGVAVADFVLRLDWTAWQTYLFGYLALSIGAELAPSDVDFRRGGLMMGLLLGLFALTIYALPYLEVEGPAVEALNRALGRTLSLLSAALFAGLVGCGLVGTVGGLIALLIGPRRHGR